LAEEELQTNIQDQERFNLPSAEELALEQEQPPDLTAIHQRIHEVARVLANFSQLRDQKRYIYFPLCLFRFIIFISNIM
jgi:ribosomal RNA methyltransferase Nop2